MIRLDVGKELKLSNLPADVKKHLMQTLTIKNPAYEKIIHVTGNRYAAQAEFRYYKEDKETGALIIPRGMRARVMNFLAKVAQESEQHASLIDVRLKDRFEKHDLILRDYQEPIIEQALQHREGIIKLSTGGGKTVIALEMIYRLGLTATVLVPNTVLLDQFVSEFHTRFGYKPGKIGGGKKVVKEITIATFQSLMSDEMLLWELNQKTSVLIVDECQGAISDERVKVLNSFHPKYLYGLSATPFRSKDDGRTNAVGFYFGNVVAAHEVEQLKPTVEVIRTDVRIEVDEYPRMEEQVVAHENRNRLIAGLACGEAGSGRRVLILVKRLEHLQRLRELLPKGDGVVFVESTDKNRNTLLGALKRGEREFSILVGTTSLLSVGTDVPSLDTMILAASIKSDVLAIQSAGRIMRLFEGKQSPKIYDLWDNQNPIFSRQFRERERVYKDKGWTIQY